MIHNRHDTVETLERLKRWPTLVKRFKAVRIFSGQHGLFWRNAAGNGYTDDPADAEVMSCEVALQKTKHCGPEKRIQFVNADVTVLARQVAEAQERLNALKAQLYVSATLTSQK